VKSLWHVILYIGEKADEQAIISKCIAMHRLKTKTGSQTDTSLAQKLGDQNELHTHPEF
jgi:hypothetical protein